MLGPVLLQSCAQGRLEASAQWESRDTALGTCWGGALGAGATAVDILDLTKVWGSDRIAAGRPCRWGKGGKPVTWLPFISLSQGCSTPSP